MKGEPFRWCEAGEGNGQAEEGAKRIWDIFTGCGMLCGEMPPQEIQ